MITVAQAFREAFAHEQAGRRDAAAAIYRQILQALPDHPGALLQLARHDLDGRRPAEARDKLRRGLARARVDHLPLRDLLIALARAEAAGGDRAAAVVAFDDALAVAPDDPLVRGAYGSHLLDVGDAAGAERQLRAGTQCAPDDPVLQANLALALAALGRWAEARAQAASAVARAPGSLHPRRVLAYVALRSHDPVAAEAAARAGLALFPDDAELLVRLGDALRAQGRPDAARELLESAPPRLADSPDLLATLGATYLDLGRTAAAREVLRRAVERGASAATTWDHLGIAERTAGDYPAALRAFAAAVAADPLLTPARTNLLKAQQEVCAWDAFAAELPRWRAMRDAPGADPRCNPFIAITLPTSAAEQLAIARRWSRRTLPPVGPRPISHRGDRLRVGYLSRDLHEHATARLMVGMFECHDASRFEVTAFSYGPDDGSALRARVRSAVEHWVDVAGASDAAAADAIRAAGIDVLVDLKGHTQGARLGILSRRPAPVQLHYLGLPGTIGFDGIDGIIADGIVLPPGAERDCHEAVHRLPRCYLANDARRALPPPAPRSALGLPDDAVVLACLNQTYKLSREFFTLWMAALAAVPAAVLWLYVPLPLARDNLRAEADRAGIDPARIVFADQAPPVEHIARLRAADLALDVLPYGSHTTGSDALWAGVPLLSCLGSTFAGRVGASLLDATGLDQLVLASPGAYGAALARLAADRDELHALRGHLETRRMQLPLFDTVGFTRDWERMLERAYDRAIPADR